MTTFLSILQGLFLILAAPGVVGLLHYFKALLQGRRRRPGNIWQPYRDLFNRGQKPAIRAETSSWVFTYTPIVLFMSYGLLAFLVPVFYRISLLPADLIVVVYLLGLARFALCLAALDTGAPFGGVGSGRDMFLHFLTEVGLISLIAGLVIHGNTVSLSALINQHWALGLTGVMASPELLLLGLSLVLLILFESGRLPIDNPATHLELTMVSKAITLEYSGRDLALVEWAEMVKLAFLLTLLIDLFLPLNLFLPFSLLPASLTIAIVPALMGWLLKVALIVLLLAWWELNWPKYRLRAVVGPALFAVAISLTAIIYIVAITLRR